MTKQERAERKADRVRSAARIAAAQLEAQKALTSNVCPQCGAGVRQNLALTGWVQCEQYGAEGFRKDSSKPACSWQGFTR